MIKKLSIIILTIILVTINVVFTFANTINFTNIKNEENLSENSINCMLQDSLGFVWIGTDDGLNRYNGYEFKIYKKNNNNDSNSIAGNYICDLIEDNNKNIWAATSNGVSKINTITGEITNYNIGESGGNLSFYIATDILLTYDNKILVSTFNGLNLYNEETNSFEQILDNEGLLSQTIYSMEQDIKGDLWIATSSGVNKINVKDRKIYDYPISLNEDTDNLLSGNTVFKVISDEKGYMWASTFSYGIYKINLNDYSVVKYTNKEGDDTSLPGNYVKDVLRDNSNQVWVATNNGLGKYNEKDGTFFTYSNKSYDDKSLIQNEVHALMQDKSGIIWVGTYSGISIFNPQSKIEQYRHNPSDSNSLSENRVTTIYEDKYGYLWTGTYSKGISIINRENGDIIRVNSEEDYNFIEGDYINYITGYDDEIYVATDYGLNIINLTTKKVSVYTEEDGITDKINNLYIDGSGNLWIGCSKGVNVLTAKNKDIIDITNYIRETRELNLYCTSIYEDKDGDIWIGFRLNGGLLKIEKNNGNYKIINYKTDNKNNSIVSGTVRSIVGDELGNIWIGTADGISKLNKNTNKFTNYTEQNGLLSNGINGILIDKNNNPWISSSSGISKLDIKNNLFENFNSIDGLQDNKYYANSYFKNNKGELFFGGRSGLDIFYPEDMKKSDYTPNLVFDEFKVNGKVINNLNNLEFKPDENEINIKLFLDDYRNSNCITYFYKLNNLKDSKENKDWVESKSNEIRYSGLPSGDYELTVKAMGHSVQMSDEEKITFSINPPWWKSTSAIMIYKILIFIAILIIIDKITNLNNLVEQRINELLKEESMNNELLTKVVTLEQNKNNYLVNLSHELRTPLNVIHTSEQLITSLNNSDKGIEKDSLNRYMEVIRKNSKRLLTLINNLIDVISIENGHYKIKLEDNDIVYIVEEAALSLKDYIESKGIELIIDPEIEEKIIKCDASEIERSIVNLVNNACKFTPKGGKIEVNIKDLGDKTEINIIDTGIGIDKKYHDIVFNRFNQFVDANSEVKGSGLGLMITKQIIQLHGGEILLESEVGKGSKFTIIL